MKEFIKRLQDPTVTGTRYRVYFEREVDGEWRFGWTIIETSSGATRAKKMVRRRLDGNAHILDYELFQEGSIKGPEEFETLHQYDKFSHKAV